MEAAARVCLPEPSLCSPRAPSCLRLDAREAEVDRPGCRGQPPYSSADGPGTRPCGAHSPSPTTPSLPPPPIPLPPPARPCGVSGSGEPGRVTRPGTARPAAASALERSQATPALSPPPHGAGLQPDSAPAPRPAAVRPPPREAESPARAQPGRSSLTTPEPKGPRSLGRGEGNARGGGSLVPAPPPAPSQGLGLARGLGQRAPAGVGMCVRAGLGAGTGRASHRGRCSSRHPGRWPSRATAAQRGPTAPQPGSPGSARLAPEGRASGPQRNCAGTRDRPAGRDKPAGAALGLGPHGLHLAPGPQHRP